VKILPLTNHESTLIEYSVTVLTSERFMDLFSNDLGISTSKQLSNVISHNMNKIEDFSLKHHSILNKLATKELTILTH